MATDTKALTHDGDLTFLQHVAQHGVELLGHALVVDLLVGTTVLARSQDISHRVVVVLLEWCVDTHVMVVGLDGLVNLRLIDIRQRRELLHGRTALILLLELGNL